MNNVEIIEGDLLDAFDNREVDVVLHVTNAQGKMGSDRAGGDWDIVLEIVSFILKDFKIEVYKL